MRQEDHSRGHDERRTQVMAEHMMVLTPPQQRMRALAREDLGDHAEPIDIGNQPREGDQHAIAPRQWDRLREGPPEEGVGDGIHVRSSMSARASPAR
jgi:hypothetical protein